MVNGYYGNSYAKYYNNYSFNNPAQGQAIANQRQPQTQSMAFAYSSTAPQRAQQPGTGGPVGTGGGFGQQEMMNFVVGLVSGLVAALSGKGNPQNPNAPQQAATPGQTPPQMPPAAPNQQGQGNPFAQGGSYAMAGIDPNGKPFAFVNAGAANNANYGAPKTPAQAIPKAPVAQPAVQAPVGAVPQGPVAPTMPQTQPVVPGQVAPPPGAVQPGQVPPGGAMNAGQQLGHVLAAMAEDLKDDGILNKSAKPPVGQVPPPNGAPVPPNGQPPVAPNGQNFAINGAQQSNATLKNNPTIAQPPVAAQQPGMGGDMMKLVGALGKLLSGLAGMLGMQQDPTKLQQQQVNPMTPTI